MGAVVFEYDLSQHGIDKKVRLQVPDMIDGKGTDAFPRNPEEQKALQQIILTELQKTQGDTIAGAVELGNARKELIEDPIGTMIKNKAKNAYDSSAGPGINIGTTLGEITEIFPGGKSPEPGKMIEGIINSGAALLSGAGEPKQVISDIGVIGTDMAIAANLVDGLPQGKFNLRNAIFAKLRQNPALGFATLVGANVAAKGSGNAVYDLINDATRTIMQLPDPEAAYENDEAMRNLMDMRAELLWSGGAMGLQHVWPFVKPFLGKNIFGVTDDIKIQTGTRIDDAGNTVPVNENMLQLAKKYGIPMNVFSTSEASFVKGAGSVIGLFPFVATKARQAQNAQQLAIADNINRTLNNLSPIGLFSDSAVIANKSFKTMIKNFTSTKTLLYNRAMDIGDKIGDKFIPVQKLREVAQNLELEYYGGKRPARGEGQLRLNQPDYSRPQTVDELLQGFTGKNDEFIDALIDLQYLADDYITGREFKKLQTQLNNLKKVAAGDPKLGTELGGVDNFTRAMIEMLNDFDNFRKFDDAGKNALVTEFAGSMGIANEFFFNNVNFTKGRVAQILGLADKNIAKITDDVDPTQLTGEQVLKILLNDETLYSPAAIKEMQAIMKPVKLPNGQIVDPVKAVARSFIDEGLRNSTKYIQANVNITGEAGLISRGTAFLTGKEPVSKTFSANFSIPIIDTVQLRSVFGLDNPNKRQSMELIFGKEQYKQIEDVMALADQVQQTSFGDVSAFVKRRGFLGGVNAITNLAFAGFVANNPFGNIGLVLAARYGMSKMADPKFMEGLTKVLNPELSDLARRQALINTVALAPELALGMKETREDVPAELQNLDPGNPYDVMKYLIFMADNNVTFPGSESMQIKVAPNGYALDTQIVKANSKSEFSQDAQSVINDIQPVNQQEKQVSSAQTDPFLIDDFQNLVKQSGVGIGNVSEAASRLSQEQRVALAGGDLDEAIALGSRRT